MKTEVYMVELVVLDYQLGSELEDLVLLHSMDQVRGYAVGSGLVDLDQGCRYLQVYKLGEEGWQTMADFTEVDLEY